VGTTGRFTVAVWAGNFDGHPMQGVSGITGAGPLLYRVVMVAAARFGTGELPSPQSAGARAVDVCRLSGMLATRDCPQLAEWFAPGTEPRVSDTWERDGLPAEYALYADKRTAAITTTRTTARTATRIEENVTPVTAAPRARLEILSPRDGDRYAMPIGVERRYATIALRSTSRGVRWRVDGRPYTRERWALTPGEHEIAAVSARGDSTSVRITVER